MNDKIMEQHSHSSVMIGEVSGGIVNIDGKTCLQLDLTLRKALSEKQDYCSQNNRCFRSAHILLALLTMKSFTYETLTKFNYVKCTKLKKQLDRFMLMPQGDLPYENFFLDGYPIVIRAKEIAESQNLPLVNDQALFLAFLTLERSTLNQFKTLWHDEFEAIVNHVKTARSDVATPHFLDEDDYNA